MKRNIIKIVLLITGVLLSLVAFDRTIPRPDKSRSYHSAILDKEALLQKLPAGKIILVGGSSVAFGYNSEKLSQQFKRPVCNLGMEVGPPLEFYLNLVATNCKKGDIVILLLEHFYWNSIDFSKPDFFSMVYCFPNGLNYYTQENSLKVRGQYLLYQLDSRIWHYIRGAHKAPEEDVLYNRANFNSYGDFVGHLTTASATNNLYIDFSFLEKGPSKESIEIISECVESCKKKGATCYISFPAADSLYAGKYKARLGELYKSCQQHFPGMVLEDPRTLLWPESDFYDTAYHLNKEGREKRTDRLIEALKERIK